MFATIFVLLAAGFATWLFLPLADESVVVVLPETTFITQIGPFQVNWMLIVLLLAAGTPIVAGVLCLVMYWLGRKGSGAGTPDFQVESARKAPAGSAEVAVVMQQLSLRGKVIAWSAIVVSVVVLALCVYLIMTPSIGLF